jgi:hypothetical protein
MGFKPGQSGNPGGRPRGGVNLTRLRKQINTSEILKVVEQAAMSGDMTAARLLLERSLPALRPVDTPVVLPPGDDLADIGRSILAAVSSGTLTPVEGSTLMGGLSQLARVIEVDELAKRVEALENEK